MADMSSPKLYSTAGAVPPSDLSSTAGPFDIRVAGKHCMLGEKRDMFQCHVSILPLSGTTDPGVAGKQNQDDYFIYESPDCSVVV